MKKYNIYCDMDGVLANFNKEPNAVERFENEIGFFYRLEPIKSNVKALIELINNKNFNVYILSASPNKQADFDKKMWLGKYLPQMKRENIILMRNGQNKADFVKTKENNILFDDYSKNVNDFIEKGFQAYQIKKYKTIKRVFQQIGC